ncbi:MAG: 50S ribosomal protein L19 [Deltaproteobacteria bacterium]|nr:50S ribosomal protein L19 [Deltaproteobacteria bacterium]
MSNVRPIIQELENRSPAPQFPDFRVGDTIRVHVRIVEGDKERVQVFEGVCIRRRHGGNRGTFTVRKVSYGVAVERTFPYYAPRVERVEVRSQGRVRRGRLYYLRDLSGKAARIRERIRPDAAAKAATKKKAKKTAAADAPAAATKKKATKKKAAKKATTKKTTKKA